MIPPGDFTTAALRVGTEAGDRAKVEVNGANLVIRQDSLSVNATLNYWGCTDGPGAAGCTTVSGSNISFAPWLREAIRNDEDRHDD